MNYKWSIIEISAKNNVITHAKYKVELLQETMKDGINLIKSRLEEQINELNNIQSVIAPWLPQVFTPNN